MSNARQMLGKALLDTWNEAKDDGYEDHASKLLGWLEDHEWTVCPEPVADPIGTLLRSCDLIEARSNGSGIVTVELMTDTATAARIAAALWGER